MPTTGKPPTQYLLPVPFDQAQQIWNPVEQRYMNIKAPQPGSKPPKAAPKKAASKPNTVTSRVKKERAKSGLFAIDDAVVLFKGDPLVIAMRKKEELQGKFPGLSGAALVRKKEMLDRKAARERENPKPKPDPKKDPRLVVKPFRGFTMEDFEKQKKLVRKVVKKEATG